MKPVGVGWTSSTPPSAAPVGPEDGMGTPSSRNAVGSMGPNAGLPTCIAITRPAEVRRSPRHHASDSVTVGSKAMIETARIAPVAASSCASQVSSPIVRPVAAKVRSGVAPSRSVRPRLESTPQA